MNNKKQKVKAAVVQDAPVLFDLEATLIRVAALTDSAAGSGAEIVLFPEAFIPAYPRGFSFGMKVGARTEPGRQLWQRYWENSVAIPGPALDQLCKIARQSCVFLSIGIIEKDPQSNNGTLYCTQLYISAEGRLLGLHRKLKPTGSERLIWGEGDGSTLTVVDTPLGRIGGLICWENYMPLARMAIYGKNPDIYLAPTADSRDNWQATLRHIACEGRCFVLGSNQFVTRAMYPLDLPMIEELATQPDVMCRGGSVIISPMGEVMAGPLFDQAGILTAELDLMEITRAKLDFDVVGHYARPDVFQLNVNESSQKTIQRDSFVDQS